MSEVPLYGGGGLAPPSPPCARPSVRSPPWSQPWGKSIVSLVNSHTNASRIGWHLWEIDLRFSPGLPPGWSHSARAWRGGGLAGKLRKGFALSLYEVVIVQRNKCSSPCALDARAESLHQPPWRQPRGKSMVSSVNSHTHVTRIGWHLWEIDLRFATGLPPGWPHDESTLIPQAS